MRLPPLIPDINLCDLLAYQASTSLENDQFIVKIKLTYQGLIHWKMITSKDDNAVFLAGEKIKTFSKIKLIREWLQKLELTYYYLLVLLGECKSLILGHVGSQNRHGFVLSESGRALRLLLGLRSCKPGRGRKRVVLRPESAFEERAREVEGLGFEGKPRMASLLVK